MEAHIAALLPTQNRVLSADENTAFLAHYDLNEHDVLRGIKTIGQKTSLLFNGSSTYVDIDTAGSLISTGNDFSFECWFNTTYVPSAVHTCVIFSAHSPGGGNLIRIGVSNTGGIFYSGANGGDGSTNGSYNDGKWHRLTATIAGTNGTPHIYVDGTEVTGVVGTQINWSGVKYMSIGQEYDGDGVYLSDFYKGNLFGVKIYKRILNTDEIANGIASESGLIGYWKLDEAIGDIAHDSSAFHNDGIILNGAWTIGNSVFTLRPKEGYFGGGAIAVEEGTINLLFKSGANNLSNRIPEAGRYTITDLGSGKYKIENISATLGANVRLYCNLSDLTNGATYTASIYYEEANKDFTIDWCDQTTVTCPAGSGRGVTTASKATYDSTFRFFDILLPIGGSAIFWGEQVEQKSFPTSFVNGTRANGNLAYPSVFNHDEGTINMWVASINNLSTMPSGLGVGQGDRPLIAPATLGNTWGSAGGEMLWYINDGDQLNLLFAGNTVSGTDGLTWPAYEWHMVTLTWSKSNNAIKMYLDGIQNGSTAAFPTSWANTENYMLGNTNANFLFDELRIDNMARTDAEISAWYYSNSPFWPRGIYRKP